MRKICYTVSMLLEEKIYQDYVEALKARDKVKTDFLSLIRAELRNASIDLKKKPLPDDDALGILKKQKKRLQESKESILAASRNDLLEKVEQELHIIDRYLPQMMNEIELQQIIGQILTEMKASSVKDMGRVMKEAIAKVGPRADAKHISDIVKSKLS